jgi:tetratricopeptide (TPR) repeat protein
MAGSEEIFKKAINTGHTAAWDLQWDKAAQAYQTALEEFPDHPKALANLGLALYELQRYDESLLVYQKALQISPDDPVPLEKVSRLLERTGKISEAVQNAAKAADVYIRRQEVEKAVENWVHITQLEPENVEARNYLAMVHERLGHIPQAINEYLAIASLQQQAGNANKAAEMIGRALHLNPTSAEARQAQTMLKNGQPLPKPMRSVGGTGMLRMPQETKQLKPPKGGDTGLDPVAETNKRALARMAEVLFDLSDDAGELPTARSGGLSAIMRGTGPLEVKRSERSTILLHIGQAIEAQTSGQDAQAVEDLEKAIETGFKDPAVYFNLGYLRSKTERLESALRNLQVAVKNDAYMLGSRLLMGQIQRQMEHLPEAVSEYMEALKAADLAVVPPDKAAELRQMYEPYTEAQAQVTNPADHERLCDNIKNLLLQPNWRGRVLQARDQLPPPEDGTSCKPLAEILVQAQSSQVIDAVGRIRGLAKAGFLRTAMEEAFDSLHFAPAYLPLHSIIGDLLIQDGRSQDAITKYTVVAQAYSSRGEASQAVTLLRRIVQAAPMDLNARNRLIDQLAAQGLVDEAIGEYLDLADIYYRLAELEMARKTYTTALRLAQQGGANRAWSVKLLQRMADIDMQRLDWRQALRIFEQIRTIQPDDMAVRKDLIQLNLRLGQDKQAADELDSFMTYLQNAGRRGEAIPFLEDLVSEDPKQILLRRMLAEEFRQAERLPDAVPHLDALVDLFIEAGDGESAVLSLESIIAMNPPNVSDYTARLAKMKSGGPPAPTPSG